MQLPNKSLSATDLKQEIETHRKSSWAELDHERLLFATTYISCGYCHIDAGKELNISNHVARRFLADPLVRAYLRDYSELVSETCHITVDFIRTKLIDILPKLEGKEEVAVFVPQMAASVTAMKFQGAEYLRAIDALGKHIGFNEIDGDDAQASAIENLLRKAAQRKREREESIEGTIDEEDNSGDE